MEIIARAASMYDEVIVAVSTNYAKKYRFSLEERLAMARETLSYLRGVSVEPMGDGLLAEYCRSRRGRGHRQGPALSRRTTTTNCRWRT